MALLQQWRDMAYDQQADKAKLQQFWAIYFTKEKDIYAELLKNPDELVRGTVKELAEKFGVDIMTMTGFLDGINDSLKAPNPIEEMEEERRLAYVGITRAKYKLYMSWAKQRTVWGTPSSQNRSRFIDEIVSMNQIQADKQS